MEVTSAGSWGVSGDALLGGYGARVLSEGAMRITSNGVSEWAIHASGTLRCNGYGNANGGGDLSQATIVLASSSSRFVANGRSLAFRTPPVDLVDVSANAPVAREDVLYAKELTDEPGEAVFGTYAFGQGALESAFGALDDAMPLTVSAYKIDGFSDHKNGDGELLAPARGSYRLAAGADESVCIPWHASAREFQDAVNGLPDVAAVGGATVTRHGDGGRRWNFGFRYEVAYDRAGTATVGTLSYPAPGRGRRRVLREPELSGRGGVDGQRRLPGNGKVALQSTTTITTCVSRSGDGDECPRGSRGDGAPDRFQPAHLRDAVVVEIDDGSWSQGDLLMGEGATLTVAQGLAVDDDASDRSPRIFATAATPGSGAAGGWYSNPTCGDLCQASPTLRVDAAGEVDVAASAAIFEATLFNRGEFKVASSGAATLGDGGGGDGDFVVAGTLTQRGGVLDLERGALSGSGSVGVSGGRVLLPGTVAPSVSVSGGEAAIRGRRADLSSVAISNGTFKVLADAANVTLSSDLIISGGALRFPERDSYAATHRNNLHSGTRNLDRGAMVVHGHLNWTDGAISGNGDVNLMASSSVRSGFIERFARVVNHAAMFLEDGAVVAETEGYMENRGTVEMREPRSTYAGMFGRRPNPREAQPVLQYDWEDNMYVYNGKRVMVVGDDSIRDASLGVSGNYD
ncbi:hypothetical protein JL721_8629 [Aureococcus anophagefferens]|nr:hypothetical protein JL721_8629 [Aureococcus anophagefferens]